MKTNKEIIEMFIDSFKEFEKSTNKVCWDINILQDKKEQLEKENQELKDKLELLEKTYNVMETVLEQRNKTIFNQQDKFLKVVESVAYKHSEYNGYIDCLPNVFIQEIKSAIEKGKE